MLDLIVTLAVIGAFCFVYALVVYACRKRLTRPQMLPVYIIIPVLSVLLLTSCGSDPSDHTGENWLLLIGLLLCWLKG